MARARNLKPGFFKNEILAKIHPLGRVLFAGLWTIADRAGRLEDRPERIKAEILPYDKCNVDALLNDLQNRGFILRYRGVIQVLSFARHQNPHKREPASELPAPNQAEMGKVPPPPTEAEKSPGKPSNYSAGPEQTGTGPALSPFPLPLSPIPIPATELGRVFDGLWKDYPEKDGKKDARRHFEATVKTDVDVARIKKALVNYLKAPKVGKGFVKNGSTWFNNWEDWVDYVPPAVVQAQEKADRDAAQERARRETEEAERRRAAEVEAEDAANLSAFLGLPEEVRDDLKRRARATFRNPEGANWKAVEFEAVNLWLKERKGEEVGT